MEAPSHTTVDFPVSAVRAVEGPFQFKPQASIVAELSCKTGADVVPRIVIGLIVSNPFQSIYRSQIKGPVAGKLMEDVGLEVPRLMGIDIFAQAKA